MPVHLLTPRQRLADRPFTHPAHTPRERATLIYMLERLCHFLERYPNHVHLPEIVSIPEPDGRSHRYVVPRPPALAHAASLSVVGFFGEKRPDANPSHFGELGEHIMREIPTHPGVLGYSNMQLHDQNFSNLVLLEHEDIKTQWLGGENHRRAVQLSPGYYTCVRIYNGTLSRLAAPRSLRLTRVKYYDFQTDPPWLAERRLT